MNNIILHREKQVSANHTTYTREGLRTRARILGVKRGRNTNDTLHNLKAHGVLILNGKFVLPNP